jgi:hypothetical protein
MKTMVEIKPLKWGNLDHMQDIPKIDTIVASELAYDDQNMGDLLATFLYFMKYVLLLLVGLIPSLSS